VGLAGRVDASGVEIFLNNFTRVNISKDCNLNSVLDLLDFKQFPAEVYLDSVLVAFFKGNFVSIRESIDFLVGGPVLNTRAIAGNALKFVLSQKVVVVECVEICAFALVWELWRVADQVASGVVPSIVEVTRNTGFVVKDMRENSILFRSLFQFFESLNEGG
jgi:hypothetical protein